MDIAEAIERINTYKQSAIFVRSDGSIVDVVEIDTKNPQLFFEEIQKNKECASRIYDLDYCGSINQQQMEQIIEEIVEGLEYAKTQGLKPGVNIRNRKTEVVPDSLWQKLKSLF